MKFLFSALYCIAAVTSLLSSLYLTASKECVTSTQIISHMNNLEQPFIENDDTNAHQNSDIQEQ